jgi:TetR/AcrR family transcriptional regulator, lmrAB and yxaGH operons repressor
MIVAARRLFRERGYLGTSFSDVLAESEAPRGSVYFHFPGGKEELGTEVAIAHAAASVADVNRAAARTSTAAELLNLLVTGSRDYLVASGYVEGCAVAPIVVELGPSSPALVDIVRSGFQDVVTTLAARLADKGVAAERATGLATTTLAGIEGALILARASRTPDAFDAFAGDVVRLAAL